MALIPSAGESDRRPLPLTTTNPSARASRRSEIMTMYKSKSDKDEYDSGKSESRSWFKPWRWFARRERHKRQPKLSPTIESLLFAFKEAKDLGIIKVNDNDGDSNNVVDANVELSSSASKKNEDLTPRDH